MCACENYIITHLSIMVLDCLLSLVLLTLKTMLLIERYHLYSIALEGRSFLRLHLRNLAKRSPSLSVSRSCAAQANSL